MHAGGSVSLLIQVQVCDGALDQVDLVVLVENHEIRFEGQVFGFAAQDAGADGVKCAQGQATGVFAHQISHAAFHLAGGFVGEGNRQDMVRAHAHGADQVGDALGEHPRFARARTGHDQHRAQARHDRLLLLGIQFCQQIHIATIPLMKVCGALVSSPS